MGRAFSEELDSIAQTLTWSASVETPSPALVRSENSSVLIVIGSGGSFTAAAALAAHECDFLQRIAIALTPLQYVQRADRLPRHHVLLISAEGKNRDILHAAQIAFAKAESTEILTFSGTSPLLAMAAKAISSRIFLFSPPWGRDGYLATNSLVASVIIGFRLRGSVIDARLLGAFLNLYRTSAKLDLIAPVIAGTEKLLVLHGTNGLVAAIDLESKLSEAAFAFTQISDLRQFAHGRHIQLAKRGNPAPVVAFISEHEEALWLSTSEELPKRIATATCALPAEPATAAIAGLLIVMALVEKIASELGQDPGQPVVPDFARRIHALDSSILLPLKRGKNSNHKIAALAPPMAREMAMQAGVLYLDRLKHARFGALVLDFDGTMCETALRHDGLDSRLRPTVTKLLREGLIIAFASGRGNSLHEDLRKHLPQDTWGRCYLGCYSGSLVMSLADPWPEEPADPAVLEIQQQLEILGIGAAQGFKLSARAAQLTIRGKDGEGIDVLFTLCTSITSNLVGWRVFRSAHSVDILAPAASKKAVISFLVDRLGVDPLTEICRIGDRGEPLGNDSELLAEGLSLTVDGVNSDVSSCWLFGNKTLNPVERAAHYLSSLTVRAGRAQFQESTLQLWGKQLDEPAGRWR